MRSNIPVIVINEDFNTMMIKIVSIVLLSGSKIADINLDLLR